ncbi:MAG: lipoate--protein ligase family protein, partial [Thermoguttaceae bacterium]
INKSMRILELTLPTPAENLALDEALLDEAEDALHPLEALRLWEPAQNMVVLGRSSNIAAEVRRDVCRELGIPILRRPSGGAAIVAGPGCLMYSLLLAYQNHPSLTAHSEAHKFVLQRVATALATLAPAVCCQGISDLALGKLKFSGNSMRAKKRHFLYHGTLLYNFPLELIDRCLKQPPRMPEYRIGRRHDCFVTNLPILPHDIRKALAAAWDAHEPADSWPQDITYRLASEKYSRPEWNDS